MPSYHNTRPPGAETAANRASLLATLIGELIHVARLEHRMSEEEEDTFDAF